MTTLPGVSRPMTPLVLGTMTFGDTVDLATAREMLDRSLDLGVTSIDTANGYAAGRSESMLGELLAGRWDDVSVATKAGMYPGDAGGEPLLSRAGLHVSVEASLRRLGTERVDLFYLHQPDRSVPLEETIGAVGELIGQGRIGAFGVSNYSAWQIADIQAVCDAQGVPRPVIAQQLYNLLARRIEDEYAEFAQEKGLATVVFNPLGGGLLTGRHQFSTTPTEGRYGDSAIAGMYRDRYWNEDTFAAVSALSAVAEQAGVTLVELAFRWLVSQPLVNAVLLGGSRTAQLEANIQAVGKGPLPDDVLAACDAATAPLSGSMPRYNR